MTDQRRPETVFRKSTFSDAGEGCVEAAILDISCLVRKDACGRVLVDNAMHQTSKPTESMHG